MGVFRLTPGRFSVSPGLMMAKRHKAVNEHDGISIVREVDGLHCYIFVLPLVLTNECLEKGVLFGRNVEFIAPVTFFTNTYFLVCEKKVL